ncbi:hypothetical protein H6F43_06270 [Leptolyngbya sp. FACHB-36]|uniref:hypothetical protein n=1 Tax=Leptolyngbya sp. FACHB-36 TaxID=2692808 RepID=UPI001680D706|nr:hypothetical protein [Leptolyngbya sp. FACHB-36]MBD2019792.1 hypothetical protein [Leptolyngbya sp. FACHB-36]
MDSSKYSLKLTNQVRPEQLDRLFPPEQQRIYISMLMGRGGLTRRRAEYFVRLWAYLLLKQQQEQGASLISLTQLHLPEGSVACTHREAAELFYGHKDRGSDRAAGLMIDRLVALGLLEKQFDGQTLCFRICSLPELVAPAIPSAPVGLEVDSFNPRTDAIPIANLITRTYAELVKDPGVTSQKIARALRAWAQNYPKGMRVLRRKDNHNPVGVAVLYPVAGESESHFFQPPSKSFYLTSDAEVDPFKMANPGDRDCCSVYVRAWMIDTAFLRDDSLFLLLDDSKKTLIEMQEDFPNLCDLYSLIVHPMYEELRLALGFQKTFQDPQRFYHWIYLALDHFLEVDLNQALAKLVFAPQ